jgi:hypothetical protein
VDSGCWSGTNHEVASFLSLSKGYLSSCNGETRYVRVAKWVAAKRGGRFGVSTEFFFGGIFP